MAIALANAQTTQYSGTVNEVSHAATVTTATTAGNTVIVIAHSNSNTLNPNAVTDSQGNTYVLAATNRDSTGGQSVSIFSGYQTTGLTTSDTITVTLAGSTASAQIGFHAAEFTNIRRPNACDQFSVFAGTDPTAPTTTTPALLTTGELAIVGFSENSTSTPTIGSGFTSLVNGLNMAGTFNRGLSAGYKLNATSSGETASYTVTSAGKNFVIVLATFVPNDFLTTQTAWTTA